MRLNRNDFVWPHHVIILVLQHMAVKDITPGIAFEPNEDAENLSGMDDCGVFPPSLVGLRQSRGPHYLE